MPLYHLSNSRTPEQLEDMLRLESAKVCIFCPANLDEDADQRVVYRNDHWTVTPNKFPYTGTKLHLLLIPHAHVADLVELESDSHAAFWPALAWIRDHYGLTSYGVGARNGDGRFTGATIEHVHVHVIVGDVDDPAHRPVRMKLSAQPDSEKESHLRERLRGVDSA
jgi:ATP adenylyltransferase